VVDDSVKELQDMFNNGLEDKCQIGAANVRSDHLSHLQLFILFSQAAEAAVETSDSFSAGMHWATYRASKWNKTETND
jgi:hypothetical protein